MKFIHQFVPARAGIFLLMAFALLAPVLALAQSSPLIMYHADNLEVARKRGTLLLQGNVHFVHDSVSFKTQRAFWNRNSETVECGGGFLFTHPRPATFVQGVVLISEKVKLQSLLVK